MTREEQIKQYCANQGFPYGACNSISSIKAIIATEAINWADNHPNGSMVKWNTGIPKSDGFYLVTYQSSYNFTPVVTALFRNGHLWLNRDNITILDNNVIAWCKLNEIKPYRIETK